MIKTKPQNHFNPLHVVSAAQEEIPEVLKVATLWGDYAQNKAKQAEQNSQEQIHFLAAGGIYDCISLNLELNISRKKHKFSISENPEILLCKDSEERVQGIMEFFEKKREICISCLATHPNNLRLPLNEQEPNRVTGVGSLLLEEAKKIATERNKAEISLQPIPTSIQFYEKQGFTRPETYNYMVYKVPLPGKEIFKTAM